LKEVFDNHRRRLAYQLRNLANPEEKAEATNRIGQHLNLITAKTDNKP
jgi:hypothetical protein